MSFMKLSFGDTEMCNLENNKRIIFKVMNKFFEQSRTSNLIFSSYAQN